MGLPSPKRKVMFRRIIAYAEIQLLSDGTIRLNPLDRHDPDIVIKAREMTVYRNGTILYKWKRGERVSFSRNVHHARDIMCVRAQSLERQRKQLNLSKNAMNSLISLSRKQKRKRITIALMRISRNLEMISRNLEMYIFTMIISRNVHNGIKRGGFFA